MCFNRCSCVRSRCNTQYVLSYCVQTLFPTSTLLLAPLSVSTIGRYGPHVVIWTLCASTRIQGNAIRSYTDTVSFTCRACCGAAGFSFCSPIGLAFLWSQHLRTPLFPTPLQHVPTCTNFRCMLRYHFPGCQRVLCIFAPPLLVTVLVLAGIHLADDKSV